MNKKRVIFCLIVLSVLISMDLFAYNSRKKYFSRPQIGVWYGPMTPVYETSGEVDTSLGGGMFFRYGLPVPNLKIGFEAAYQPYTSEDTLNELTLVPVYSNFVYLIPIRMPLRIQLKAGAGGCRIHMEPDGVTQWDPMFATGLEISFPAGKLLNVALRLDYLLLYEKHIEGAEKNGHFFNAGISMYLNLNI